VIVSLDPPDSGTIQATSASGTWKALGRAFPAGSEVGETAGLVKLSFGHVDAGLAYTRQNRSKKDFRASEVRKNSKTEQSVFP